MAIQKEFLRTRSDGVKLFRTYSDADKFIVQTETGAILREAVDIETATFNYSESDEAIPKRTEEGKNAD